MLRADLLALAAVDAVGGFAGTGYRRRIGRSRLGPLAVGQLLVGRREDLGDRDVPGQPAVQ